MQAKGSRAPTRRRFLFAGAVVGATATSAPALLTGCTAPPQARGPSAPDWAALARDLNGRLLRKDDPDYRRFASPYNLAYDTADRMPQGIALCATPADVSTSIKWAKSNGIALRARAGGHSYGGYSTTPDFMIDVSAMRSIAWDPSTKRVTVASGARNGDLYKALQAENRMLTHGRCPTVGVAGFLLGGGIGFNMRLLGVASDDLVATEIVTADGRIRRLPDSLDDGLFWACRGAGGGNFGINTEFTLGTHPAGNVTVFNIDWQGTRDQIEAVVYPLMQDLDGAPDGFGSRFSLPAPSKGVDSFGINLIGQFHGPRRTVDQLLSRAIGIRQPSSKTIQETSYWNGQEFLVDSDPPFRFHERSAFLTRSLGAAEIHAAFDWLSRWPGGLALRAGAGEVTLGADIRFFQTGQRMNDRAPGATAFVHRSSHWILDIGIAWTQGMEPQAFRQWQDRFFDAMRPSSNGEAYQNFIDPALTDWASAYYASNLGRLSEVKGRVDRGELFKFPQSIPPPRG